MKKINLLLIIGFICTTMFGQTNFQGGIYSDAVWTKQNSPYIITGDVVLFPGKTLTIEPGVEVKFNGSFFLEIRGILNSIGSDTARITYTKTQTPPPDSNWIGIKIMNNQGAKASFEYSDLSYAYNAIYVECCGEGGPIYFKHCNFDHNDYVLNGYTGYPVLVDSCNFAYNTYCILQADKTIRNCTFTNNEYGLYGTERIDIYNSIFSNNYVAVNGGRGIMESCSIFENHIAVQGIWEGYNMRNNDIYNNDTALILSNYDGNYLPIKNNRICKNNLNAINMNNINVDLTENCWCSTDSADIETRLVDGYDDIYLGLFNYDIYSDSCDIVVKSIIKVQNINNTINQMDAENVVDVYPNPFDSQLTIENSDAIYVEIYSAQGLKLKRMSRTSYTTTIDTSDLASGIYFLQIITTKGVSIKKVIKK
jgi:hypothetical protein